MSRNFVTSLKYSQILLALNLALLPLQSFGAGLGICEKLTADGQISQVNSSVAEQVRQLQAQLAGTLANKDVALDFQKQVQSGFDAKVKPKMGWIEFGRRGQAKSAAQGILAKYSGQIDNLDTGIQNAQGQQNKIIADAARQEIQVFAPLAAVEAAYAKLVQGLDGVKDELDEAKTAIERAKSSRQTDAMTSDKPNQNGGTSMGERASDAADRQTKVAEQEVLEAQQKLMRFNQNLPQYLQNIQVALAGLEQFPNAKMQLTLVQVGGVDVRKVDLEQGTSTWIGQDSFANEQAQLQALEKGLRVVKGMIEGVQDLMEEAQARVKLVKLEYAALECQYKNVCLVGFKTETSVNKDDSGVQTDLAEFDKLAVELSKGRTGTFWVTLTTTGVVIVTALGYLSFAQ